MSIRSAAKAIIINDGKVLINKYIGEKGGEYYELPGGGQLQYETLEEAVIRECMEETGYPVRIIRLAVIAEEIYEDPELRERFPDYVHKIHHIFIAEISGEKAEEPAEKDLHQVDSIWMDIEKAQELFLFPRQLRHNLSRIIASDGPLYLGSVHEDALMK